MSPYTREFKAYCVSQGRTPPAQLAHDAKEFPGGKMCGFISWMAEALKSFKASHPEAWVGPLIHDHNKKLRFLREYAEKYFRLKTAEKRRAREAQHRLEEAKRKVREKQEEAQLFDLPRETPLPATLPSTHCSKRRIEVAV